MESSQTLPIGSAAQVTQPIRPVVSAVKLQISVALCLALVLALASAIGIASMPSSPAITHDSANYLSAAENLARTGHFVYSVPDTLSQQRFETKSAYMPGYQTVIAGLLVLGLPSGVALYLLTLVGLLALTTVSFGLGYRLSRSVIGGLLAALWTLFMPQILDVMTHALTETLFIPFTVAALFLAAWYLQESDVPVLTRRHYALLGVLAFVMSWSPMIRAFGLGLIPAICGPMLLRSLLRHRRRRMLVEASVGVVAALPTVANMVISYIINGCAYCGVTPNRVDLSDVAVTRGWIAKLMLSNFVPELQLNLGLRGLLQSPSTAAILLLLLGAFVGVLFYTLYKYRSGVRRVLNGLAYWERLPVYVFIAIYLLFIFGTSTPGVYVAFNYPRYLVPLYPLIIGLVVAVSVDIFRLLPAWWVRVALILTVLAYGFGTAQTVNAFVLRARDGRGIEAASTRNHPAWAYLNENLRTGDVIFSTKAPTVWYYTRQPTHRLDGVDQLHCKQLALAGSNGRSVFVLFPFYVFKGNPTDAESVAWFKDWIGHCGKITATQLFKTDDAHQFDDAAIYIVEPK